VGRTSHELDLLDRRILDVVQQNANITADRLSDLVGASRSSVQRRLRTLRDDRVIEAERAIISPEAVGRPMAFVVSVTLERESPEITAQFVQRVCTTEAVQQCFYVTGDADFVLVVTATGVEDYDQIVQDLFVRNPAVRRFTTNVVIRRTKTGLAIPVLRSAGN
jgi:Lrp/AsnC family transcriptional regulator, leucine-responsive regulatory protein